MPDRQSPTDVNDEAVASALRGLPQATPAPGGWEAMAASLRAAGLVREESDDAEPLPAPAASPHPAHTPRTRRQRQGPARWIPVALAAGLALFALVLLPRQGAGPDADPTRDVPTAAATNKAELAVLRGESARIEEWLRSLRADETPLDGRSLMAATEIEDMIGLVDLQLAAGPDGGSDAHALWATRVELLRDLAAIRTTYSLAGTGIAANGTAATPDLTTL